MKHLILPIVCLAVWCVPPGAADAESILAPGAAPILLQERGAGEGPAWHPELGLLTAGGTLWSIPVLTPGNPVWPNLK